MASSQDLTQQQREVLSHILTRQSGYLHRLVRRMEKLEWPTDDPLHARAQRARDAALSLCTAVQELATPKQPREVPAWIRARGP